MTPWFSRFFQLLGNILNPAFVFTVAVAAGLYKFLKNVYDTPSRPYVSGQGVGQEYDDWEQEGILEYYWGEHIHLGFYNDQDLKKGYLKKDFKQAKYDLIEEMLTFSDAQAPSSILDVGCGIGGTTRYLAKKYSQAKVLGITISKRQVERGTSLAKERDINNVEFRVVDALNMDIKDNSYDLVWGCESGEHMPDKKKYIEEMIRVLKPGGTLLVATWCQRHSTPENPLTNKEKKDLQFLYDEWGHPYFISVQDYVNIVKGTNKMENIKSDDWNKNTISSWWHSIWVGVFDPLPVFTKPQIWYKTSRDIITLIRFHNAYAKGLMGFGIFKAQKKQLE